MSCGLPTPEAPRWIELPGDPEPLRRELAARRAAEEDRPSYDENPAEYTRD